MSNNRPYQISLMSILLVLDQYGELVEDTDIDAKSYIKKSPPSSFVMSPANEADVPILSSQLNPSKSSLDIPNKLVRLARQPLAIPFALLYNESILFVTVPDVLKISKIVPVYKGGIMTESGNYRPISTLSPFSKTFERLINNQLLSFVEKQDILHQFQFGFRKGYSTEKAILEITDNLKTALDNKLYF